MFDRPSWSPLLETWTKQINTIAHGGGLLDYAASSITKITVTGYFDTYFIYGRKAFAVASWTSSLTADRNRVQFGPFPVPSGDLTVAGSGLAGRRHRDAGCTATGAVPGRDESA